MVAVNAHPFAPAGVVMAMGEDGSSWADWGTQWDQSLVRICRCGRGLWAPVCPGRCRDGEG